MRRSLVAFCIVGLLAGRAAKAAPNFRFERPITPAGAGPNRLSIDVPLLTGARPLQYGSAGFVVGLDDLRLYDSAGREVGYLLITPSSATERWALGSITPVNDSTQTSGFEVDLGQVMNVDRLRLDGVAAPFLKRLKLEGSGDTEHWIVLVDDGTLFDLPNEHLKRTDLEFAPRELRYLRLRWDDRNSALVPLPASVSARQVGSEPAPPQRVPLSFERTPSEPGKSRFRIHLPGTHLPLAAIELVAGAGHLRRMAVLTEPRLSGAEVSPTRLGAHLLMRAQEGDAVAADLRIPMTSPDSVELDLEVDDGNNPPLELLAAEGELLPLPWIFFESSNGESLRARFGDPHLGPPRYDLEAVRADVNEQDVGNAAWGDRRDLEPQEAEPFGTMSASLAGGVVTEPRRYQYRRPIADGDAGLVAVALDAAVLAHSVHLRDLRIVGAEDQQTPYVVERMAAPRVVDLPPLRKAPEPTPGGTTHESIYRLQLPFKGLPPAQLVLQTSGRVFQRQIRLTVERPGKDGRSASWQQSVTTATWAHTDEMEHAKDLVLTLPSLDVNTLDLRIDDGDNAPLPLGSVRLLLPAYRLRFFRTDNQPLTLLYGNLSVDAPRYDLALLAPRVLEAEAHEAVLGTEEDTHAGEAAAERDLPKSIFWIALVLAVVALVALIMRLLRSAEL